MRDPKRIPGLIARLQATWETMPDLRLAQLIGNVWRGDPYYVEDEKFISEIETHARAHTMSWYIPTPGDTHYDFWQHIKNGGKVHRKDTLNGVEEDLTLEKLNGNPNNIYLYGYADLSIIK